MHQQFRFLYTLALAFWLALNSIALSQGKAQEQNPFDRQYADKALARGTAALRAGDHEKAIIELSEALRLQPKHVLAFATRADAFRMKSQFDRAIADASEAIRLDPKYVSAYVIRAEAYRMKNDYDRAIADASAAIRLDPKYVHAYFSRAEAYLMKRDNDRAIADASEALRLDPKYVHAYCTRGIALGEKGELTSAIADLTKALRLNPNFEFAKAHLAAIQKAERELRERLPNGNGRNIPVGWEEFTSKPGGFSIWLPGRPTEKSEEVQTTDGPVALHSVGVQNKNRAFSLLATGEFRNDLTDEQRFEGARDGLLNSTKGKLISLTKIKLGAYPGRDIQVKAGKGDYGRARVYLVGKRLYQVLLVCPNEDDLTSEEAEAYFSSFRLIQAQAKEPPKHFTNSIGMKFVWIQPGSFMMGSPKGEEARNADETQHKVTLTKGFYMAAFTVTQEQWQTVMGNNPSKFKDEKNLPVDSVSWNDCQEFIKKLREKDKQPYRLPTEAEWEYACRAGTTTPYYCGEDIFTDQANYNGDFRNRSGMKGKNRGKTTPVGSFPANGWGLHDMQGNVPQWCQDWYGEYPKEDVVDPQGPNAGRSRVRRGGTWVGLPESCRSADRNSVEPGLNVSGSGTFGFRLCFFLD